MPDPLGQLLTRWTIRLALVCYVACLAGVLAGQHRKKSLANAQLWVWTIGCVLFLAHVACAFHYYHRWSHVAAYDDTALQTEELLGFAFGGGIYFSYLFTGLWLADVLWRWTAPQLRPAWFDLPLHAYMLFIAFNGAIVFEGGISRWAGIVACVGLATLAVWRLRWGRLSAHSETQTQ